VLEGIMQLQNLIQEKGPRGITGLNPRQTEEPLVLGREIPDEKSNG